MAAGSAANNRFLENWSPRVGEDAAQHQLRAQRFIAAATMCCVSAWFVGWTLKHFTGIAIAVTVQLLVPSAGLLLFALGLRQVARARRSISDHFGVQVGLFSGPIFGDYSFQRFKQRHGC